VKDNNNSLMLGHKDNISLEWRSIPGFSKYLVSETGLVKNIQKNKIMGNFEIKTSKGTYIRVGALSDDYKTRSVGAHQLVCLAFHGLPPQDGKKYEVNHKDGNKHNNHYTNLEWVTRTDNLKHAHKERLRKESIIVVLKDTITGEEVRYHSQGEFLRIADLKYTELISIFRKFKLKNELYLGRYEIHFDYSDKVTTKHSWVKVIIAVDGVTGETFRFTDSMMAEFHTNIKRETILYNYNKDKLTLCAGWLFMQEDDSRPKPIYSKEDALLSRKQYFSKKEPAKKRYGILVKDLLTGEETEYHSLNNIKDALDISSGTLQYLLKCPRIRPFKGYCFKYQDNTTEWPVYPKIILPILREVVKPDKPVIIVEDQESGDKKAYPSITAFAKHLNMNPTVVNANYHKGYGIFKHRYKIQQITL
jgi:hypothetical protein